MADDLSKVWTTVGSAGVLNPADLAKVTLHQSIIQLGTEIIAQPQTAATPNAAISSNLLHPPTIQAVARYNVTSVDGLFNPGMTPHSLGFKYVLKLRCRGQVSANLIEVNTETGIEHTRISFSSDNKPGFEVQSAIENSGRESSVPFDFTKNAYYVEATLTASALVLGHPAAISIIQISAPNPTGSI
jgi:hypothetical protein